MFREFNKLLYDREISVQQQLMGLYEAVLDKDHMTQAEEVRLISKEQQVKLNAKLSETAQSQPGPFSPTKRVKFIMTILTIIFTSFQVYDITTHKLQHSRNFIRFLNYYLIQHTGFDIYWAGQYMVNYPIQQYFLISEVNDFLKRFQHTMKGMDESVYGFMEFEQFLNRENKIYLLPKTGGTLEYNYVISHGFKQPFRIDDIDSIKKAILSSQEIQITMQQFKLNHHIWNVMLSITTFSQSSIFVQIYAHQEMSLWKDHILTFLIGVIFLALLLKQYMDKQIRWVDNIPDYLVCIFLLNTFFVSLDVSLNVKWVVILDGVQCLAAWLLILKFLQKDDDYHISFLIKKSYAFVGRLFISFGPIFIAFTLFGYTLFCREAWQFSTFRRTFLTLFYISYYNATYESFIVTSRANPISMIFFFSFVILFTICVYSGMLVSVFCSYMWNKRESKIKQEIVDNLKIQCSQCSYKYKYVDCVKMLKESRRTLKMSFIMQVDFQSSAQRSKYKKMITKKANYLVERMEKLLGETRKEVVKSRSEELRDYMVNELLERVRSKIKVMLKEELPNTQEMLAQRNDKGRQQKEKNL